MGICGSSMIMKKSKSNNLDLPQSPKYIQKVASSSGDEKDDDTISILSASNNKRNLYRIMNLQNDTASQLIAYCYSKTAYKNIQHSSAFDKTIQIISEYYGPFYLAIFNKQKCGKYLYFQNDRTVIKTRNDQYSVCSFGCPVGNNICNTLEIHFKITSLQNILYIGYLDSTFIQNLQQPLGIWDNKYGSVGVEMCLNETYFTLYDQRNSETMNCIKSNSKLKVGDILCLIIDFDDYYFELYHNDYKVVMRDLTHYQGIIPSFTLYNKNDSIEVIKWTLQ